MATDPFAIIDIGSNSIRYAEEKSGGLPDKEVYTTRLGSGLSRSGRLADETMDASIEVMRELAGRARRDGFIPRAYATSAIRDAMNGREFAKRVEAVCGFPVEVLSGEKEARYAFLGAAGGDESAVMLDIGGASMQVVTKDLGLSFRAGCVRCGDIARERTRANDCDERWEEQRAAVRKYMDGAVKIPDISAKKLIGVGGTITTLAAIRAGLTRFDAAAVERTALSREDVGLLITRLVGMREKRREHPMLAARHDVILYGAYILEYAMEKLRAETVRPCCRDGMEGYLFKVKNEK